MTNFEWFKSDDERLKDFLTMSFAVDAYTGKVTKCYATPCSSCLFSSSKNNGQSCDIACKEWLNKEYNPLYKKGDIVIDNDGDLNLVLESTTHGIRATNNINNLTTGIGYYVSDDEIKRKVGNIYENTDKEV